jgi:hypothetical protein
MTFPTEEAATGTGHGPLFRDFDNEAVFEDITASSTSAACKNFLLEFGPFKARIATDLTALDLETLSQKPRDPQCPIRWM